MSNKDSIKLNIGAGITYIPGFINIDLSEKADISLNLNHDRLPFNDNCVDVVYSNHTLEHFDDYLFAIGEIHRVLKHGGKLLLSVPYLTLTQYNLVNPYHKQNFNEYSFDFFDPDKLLNSAAEDGQILYRKICHRFTYLPDFANKPQEEKDWARRHYFNVVREIAFGVLAIKEKNSDLKINSNISDQLLEEYDLYTASRIRHSTS